MARGPLEKLEERLGYRFMRREYLELALTHPSCSGNGKKPDNQRLEFLGDAILGMMLANQLYVEHPEQNEGELTVLRSRLASGEALAKIAGSIGLGEFLRLSGGADQDNQRGNSSNLAAALEAVLGAAWVDGGMDAAVAVYNSLFSRKATELDLSRHDDNPKGKLQEMMQAEGLDLPQYSLVEMSGPEHAPHFIVEVEAGAVAARGEGGSKRLAEFAAATAWLEKSGER